MGLRIESKDVGSVGVCNRRKADPLVKACRLCVLSTQAHTAEVGPGLLNETADQCSSYALVSPRRAHVNAADATHIWAGGKGITI